MDAMNDVSRMQPARAWPVAENFLPDFELPSSEGPMVSTSGYRYRRSLVLVFAGEHTDNTAHTLLSDLARQYREIERENAEVLAVVHGTSADAARVRERYGLPFPVLADRNGQVHREYGAVTPDDRAVTEAVYVAGRFGKVYLSSRATDGPPLPTSHDILGRLHFIEAQCPECGQDEPLL